MDGSLKRPTDSVVSTPPIGYVSRGACEACEHNFDRNRCHDPIVTDGEGVILVKCATQAPKREAAALKMIPAQVAVKKRRDCLYFQAHKAAQTGEATERQTPVLQGGVTIQSKD